MTSVDIPGTSMSGGRRDGSGRIAERRGHGIHLTRSNLESLGLPSFWVVLVIVFGALRPGTFLTASNFSNIFGSQAVLLVLALGLSLPLLAGDFDLSVANTLTLSGMIVAILNVHRHWPLLAAALIAVLASAVIGLINAIIVVKLRRDSFIITLGTGSVIAGVVFWVSKSYTISGVSPSLVSWVFTRTFLSIPLEFWYGAGACLILLYVVSLTPVGQRVLFVGQAREVARLSGIRTDRIRIGCLVLSSVVAALAGILYLGTTAAADPSSGTTFLLPAFAAVYLGSTSIRPGRFNPLGTFVAVYFLSTGISGLELLGAQSYIQQLFYGLALVLAVSVAVIGKKREQA